MKIGKNTSTTTTAWLERGDRSPNQALKIGASAMIGTALTATARGVSVSLAARKAVTSRANVAPTTTPASRPVTMMKPVTPVAVMMASKFSATALPMSEGGGSTKPSGRNTARIASQPPKMTTAAIIGGSQERSSAFVAVTASDLLAALSIRSGHGLADRLSGVATHHAHPLGLGSVPEGRDDLLAVGVERLVLGVVHQVDGELVDTQVAQLL